MTGLGCRPAGEQRTAQWAQPDNDIDHRIVYQMPVIFLDAVGGPVAGQHVGRVDGNGGAGLKQAGQFDFKLPDEFQCRFFPTSRRMPMLRVFVDMAFFDGAVWATDSAHSSVDRNNSKTMGGLHAKRFNVITIFSTKLISVPGGTLYKRSV
ncbi:uncharacterized protein Dvar_18330 [Desulfosarcina variabilis str. Montpellier]